MGVLGVGILPIESPPTTSKYISIQSFALSAAVRLEFQCQIILLQYDPPFGGLGCTHRVENGTNRNADPMFLFDFVIRYRSNLHRLATIHNAADRAIGIELCQN